MKQAVVAGILLALLGCQQKVYDPVGAQEACGRFLRHAFASEQPAGARLDIEPSNVDAQPGSPVHRVFIRATMHTAAGVTPIKATCTVRHDGDDWTLVDYTQEP